MCGSSSASHGLDPALVEELTQAAFVTAYRKLDRYEPRGAFRAWLKAIARNLMLHELRERRRWATQRQDCLELIAVEDALDLDEDAVERDRQLERLRVCLDRLAPAARELVEARYASQCGSAQIAAALGRSEVWVRVTLLRIRRTLRGCIEATA